MAICEPQWCPEALYYELWLCLLWGRHYYTSCLFQMAWLLQASHLSVAAWGWSACVSQPAEGSLGW